VKHKIDLVIPNHDNIKLELDDSKSPNTITEFLKKLPFTVGINLWGEEIYTEPTPINVKHENPKELVSLNDVAYWPPGRAICLFYGPTPIGNKGEIKPYSPVNVIGKITDPDKTILSQINEGTKVTFQKS
jgi:hypothetical protein